ncbi:hypothetical protein D3C71_1349100 [compost metagenome]
MFKPPVSQKLNISFPSGNGRESQPLQMVAELLSHAQHVHQHLAMNRRIPDDSRFAHLLPASLELRFDERHDISGTLQQFLKRRQNNFERNERDVNARKIRSRPLQIRRRHITEIGPFHDTDALIFPERPIQLVVANINGIYIARSVLQRAVGKSAGRSADIEHRSSGDINSEGAQRLLQLEPAPAHIGMHSALHLKD